MKIKRRDLLAVLILLLLLHLLLASLLTYAFLQSEVHHRLAALIGAVRYRPTTFFIGLAISAATLLIGAVVAVAARRRPQQEGAPTAHGP
jgi:ABC-type Fe3+ transport system permease subunit